MKRILVAVDHTKTSVETVKKVAEFFGGPGDNKITLIHVERMAGMSVLDDTLPVGAELEAMKQGMQGSERQEKLDQTAKRILDYYQNYLKEQDITGVEVMIKEGHPCDEILAAAKEVQADIICIGSREHRFHNIFLGSVSREVANGADVSVLIIR